MMRLWIGQPWAVEVLTKVRYQSLAERTAAGCWRTVSRPSGHLGGAARGHSASLLHHNEVEQTPMARVRRLVLSQEGPKTAPATWSRSP
jgi:hypothetical protein